jgi:hypothetical protein
MFGRNRPAHRGNRAGSDKDSDGAGAGDRKAGE